MVKSFKTCLRRDALSPAHCLDPLDRSTEENASVDPANQQKKSQSKGEKFFTRFEKFTANFLTSKLCKVAEQTTICSRLPSGVTLGIIE